MIYNWAKKGGDDQAADPARELLIGRLLVPLGDRFVDTHICRPRYIHTYEKERQIHVRMRSKICSHIMRVDLDS